jgi:subtilisin family serine protease
MTERPGARALGPGDPLGLVRLTELTSLSTGTPDLRIGLVDGLVDTGHPDLAGAPVHHVGVIPEPRDRAAAQHATFAAGILVGRRGGAAPALVPRCPLLVAPIFGTEGRGTVPSASPAELADALTALVVAGTRVINVSAELISASPDNEQRVRAALDLAARRGILIVTAAGNRGRLGSSVLTRHPWVISVVACTLSGTPARYSNLALSSARHGLLAPGEGVTGPAPVAPTGTSVAAPLVTGAIALVWSLNPQATPHTLRAAILGPDRRRGIVPPLLDAWAAYVIVRKRGGDQ